MAERLNLTVEDGVGDMLTTLAGGERKRGQWISDLVKAMHEQYTQIDKTDMEQLKLGFAGLTAQMRHFEERLLGAEASIRQLEQRLG